MTKHAMHSILVPAYDRIYVSAKGRRNSGLKMWDVRQGMIKDESGDQICMAANPGVGKTAGIPREFLFACKMVKAWSRHKILLYISFALNNNNILSCTIAIVKLFFDKFN